MGDLVKENLMDVAREFSWISIYESESEDEVFELEKVFYTNKIPARSKECDSGYCLTVPFKYEELCRVVMENALNNNLDTGVLREKPEESIEDKIVVDHSYESPVPKKFFWMVLGLIVAVVAVMLMFT